MRNFFILFCGVALLSACSLKDDPIRVTRDGDTIVIEDGANRLTARSEEGERTDTFLVAAGTGRGIFPFTAHFSVVSSSGVRRLMRTCDNVLDCRARGVFDHPDHVTSMFLYAANDRVAERLRKIDAMAMAWTNPIVEMTFIELNDVVQTKRITDIDVKVDSAEYSPKFLVTDVVLLKDNLGTFSR